MQCQGEKRCLFLELRIGFNDCLALIGVSIRLQHCADDLQKASADPLLAASTAASFACNLQIRSRASTAAGSRVHISYRTNAACESHKLRSFCHHNPRSLGREGPTLDLQEPAINSLKWNESGR